MERFDLLNKLLLPADLLMSVPEWALKRLGLYSRLQRPAYYGIRRLMTLPLKAMNKLEVVGAEHVPATGGALLVSNHQSWLDVECLVASCPRQIHFVAKDMLYDFPVLRRLLTFSQALKIRRGGGAAGLEDVIEALKQGKVVAIFPEGTIPGEEDIPRTAVEPETGLLRGKTGMIRAAAAAGVPLIPVGVSGSGRALPPEMYPRLETLPLPASAPVTVKFGPPITVDAADGTALTSEALRRETDRVMRAISQLVDFSRHLVPMDVPLTRSPWTPPPVVTGEAPARDGKQPLGVLVLHGFTSAIDTVSGIGPHLERLGLPYRMPYLRGHGTYFRDLDGATAADWYADAEQELLKLLETCQQVAVVGLSMGGLVALNLAANHPQRIAAVVTVAPALAFTDPMAPLSGKLAKLFRFWPSPNAYTGKECAQRNRNYAYLSTKAFASLYEYSQTIPALLPNIVAPLLILQHRINQVVNPKGALTIMDKAGSAEKRLVWFEKSGHEMMLDQEADHVFAEISQFLAAILKRQPTPALA